MKNNKFIYFLAAVILVCLGFTAFIMISSCNNEAYVKLYTADVVVDEYGNITVDEYLVTNMRYLEREVKTGKNHYHNPLFYNIGYDYYKNDTATFVTNEAYVKLYKGDYFEDAGCREITDLVSNSNKKVSSGSIYIDGREILTLDDMATFHFHFVIQGMVTSYNDCAELNYILFEEFGCKVKKLGVTVTLPDNDADFEDVYCYGHGLNRGSIKQNGTQSIDYVSKNIGASDELEMRIVFPTSLVNNINDNNVIAVNMKDKIVTYENDLHNKDVIRNIVAIIINVVTVAVVVGMVLITIHVYKKYDKEFTPKFDKEYLRELPFKYTPAEMGYLYYFGKTNDEDVTATLLDLIRRGFVKMDYFGETDAKDPDFTFSLNQDKLNSNGYELLDHEKHLITWFFNHIGNGSEVTIKQIESYGKKYNNATQFESDGKKFKSTILQECKGRDWFLNLKTGKSKASSFAMIPIGAGILFFIVCSLFVISAMVNYVILAVVTVVYLGYVATIKKRTVNGNEEYAQWKAFGHFLEDFSTMEDYPMPGLEIWEEYLVYATTLKLADKVMEQLKVKLPELDNLEEGTYMRTYYMGHSYGRFYITNSISNAINRAHYTSVSTISAHNAQSHGGGHGHGGGFSSGSSFGGGGGGFHGGR